MLANWQPVAHFPRRGSHIALAFPLDHSFETAGVVLCAEEDEVVGTLVRGPADTVGRQVARMLSLDVDATAYADIATRDPAIGRVMRAHPGLRPVLFPSPYEAAVWAVMSQRIAQRQAATTKAALSAEHGDAVELGSQTVRALPSPERLLRVRAARGLTPEKIERLHAVARAALEGVLDADRLRALGYAEAVRVLQDIRGIGPFWSGAIYLRACGVTEPFPIDEPRTLRALADAHDLAAVPTGDALRAMVAKYEPFGMWVSVLLRVAANRGTMGEGARPAG